MSGERFGKICNPLVVQLFPLNPSMHTSSMVSLPNACFVWKQWMNTRTPASCEDNKIIMKWLEIPNQPVYCDGINGFLWLLINGSLSWSCGTWWNLRRSQNLPRNQQQRHQKRIWGCQKEARWFFRSSMVFNDTSQNHKPGFLLIRIRVGGEIPYKGIGHPHNSKSPSKQPSWTAMW